MERKRKTGNAEKSKWKNELVHGEPVNPMQQFIDLLVGAFNRNPARVNVNPPAVQVSNKDFKSVGLLKFRGTIEPIEAQWDRKGICYFQSRRGAKDRFVTYMMKGEANFWWETIQNRVEEGVVAWERFKELYFEIFFPPSMQSRMEMQFLELKQGDLLVP